MKLKKKDYEKLMTLIDRAVIRNQWNYWYDCRRFAGMFLFNGELQQFNRLLRKVEISAQFAQAYARMDLDKFLMERTVFGDEKYAC